MKSKIQLTAGQAKQLLALKRKSNSAIIRDRAQALLLRNNGLTIADISQALLRGDKFVKTAIKKYQQGKLAVVNFGGHNYKLSPAQRQEIIKLLKTASPRELAGFDFAARAWSPAVLKKIIREKYKLEYKTEKSYRDLFKAAGLPPGQWGQNKTTNRQMIIHH